MEVLWSTAEECSLGAGVYLLLMQHVPGSRLRPTLTRQQKAGRHSPKLLARSSNCPTPNKEFGSQPRLRAFYHCALCLVFLCLEDV